MGVKFQPVKMSNQLVACHLVVFKMVWKSLPLFWLWCQTKSISCFDKSTDCFCENLNKILLRGFNLF